MRKTGRSWPWIFIFITNPFTLSFLEERFNHSSKRGELRVADAVLCLRVDAVFLLPELEKENVAVLARLQLRNKASTLCTALQLPVVVAQHRPRREVLGGKDSSATVGPAALCYRQILPALLLHSLAQGAVVDVCSWCSPTGDDLLCRDAISRPTRI